MVQMSQKSKYLLNLGFKKVKDEFEREMGKFFKSDKFSVDVSSKDVSLKLIAQLPHLETQEYFYTYTNGSSK